MKVCAAALPAMAAVVFGSLFGAVDVGAVDGNANVANVVASRSSMNQIVRPARRVHYNYNNNNREEDSNNSNDDANTNINNKIDTKKRMLEKEVPTAFPTIGRQSSPSSDIGIEIPISPRNATGTGTGTGTGTLTGTGINTTTIPVSTNTTNTTTTLSNETDSPSFAPSITRSTAPTVSVSAAPSKVASSIPSSAPTIDVCPSPNDALVKIQLTTDSNPEFTHWYLSDKHGEQAIHSSNEYVYEANTTYTHEYCVPKFTDCYSFVIFDSDGNGITCPTSETLGSSCYKISYDYQVIKEGAPSSFQISERTKFGKDCIERTCDSELDALMVFTLNIGYYIYENTWDVVDSNGVTVETSNSYRSAQMDYKEVYNACLYKNDCYTFRLHDLWGNGLNAYYQNGFFNLTYNGVLIGAIGDATFTADSDFGRLISYTFGYGCESASPSISLSPSTTPPTSLPTSAPTTTIPTISAMPSGDIDTETPTESPTEAPTVDVTTVAPTPDPFANIPIRDIMYTKNQRRQFPKPFSIESEEQGGQGGRTLQQQQYQRQLQPEVPTCNKTEGEAYTTGCIPTYPSSVLSKPFDTELRRLPICTTDTTTGKTTCSSKFPKSIPSNALKAIGSPLLHTRGEVFDSLSTEVQLPIENEMMSWVVEAADLNGDGWEDVVIGNYVGYDNVIILNNKGSFDDPSNVIVIPGTKPFMAKDVAIGDVNGDGYPDIVFANEADVWTGEDTATAAPNQLVMNNGDGTFATPIPLHGGANLFTDSRTFSVELCDVDDDGHLDLLVGNRDQVNIIMYNDGTGSFLDDIVSFPGASMGTFRMRCADMDQDGHMDVVVSNTFGYSQIFYGDGSRTFGEGVDIQNDNGDKVAAISVSIGDIDGDGNLDLVFGFYFRQNQVIYGKEGRKFATPLTLPSVNSKSSYDTDLSDIDGDGYIDLVVANFGSPNQIFFNTGGKFISPPVEFGGDVENRYGIAIKDFDKNGYPDILSVTFDDNPATVLYNQKDATSLKSKYISIGLYDEMPLSTEALVLVDINNDGFLDIVEGDQQEEANVMWYGAGGGKFIGPIKLPTPHDTDRTTDFAFGDFDKDGNLDLVVCNSGSENYILYGYDDGRFDEDSIELLPGGQMNSETLVVGDLDGDGNLDIVVGNKYVPDQILFSNGNGKFLESGIDNTTLGDETETEEIVLADIDGDNKLDIVVVTYKYGGNTTSDTSLAVYYNSGGKSFEEQVVGILDKTMSVAVGDLTGSGTLDIVIGNDQEEDRIFYNKGNKTFQQENFSTYEIDPSYFIATTVVELADMDADGFVDIVIGVDGDSSVTILYNKGDGTFDPSHSNSLIQGGIQALKIGDIDDDGFLDILVGDFRDVNKILFFSPCPNGGAQLNAGSWCYQCPDFMGHPTFLESIVLQSVCKECLPDYMQDPYQVGICADEPCFLQQRAFGENTCTKCPGGTFYNNKTDEINRLEDVPSTWLESRCGDCEKGQFSKASFLTVDTCFECLPGTFQNETRETFCFECQPGYFQAVRGQESCEACATGGYCDVADTCDGGFTPCTPGTYNDKIGQSHPSACIPCPAGTYSTEVGANSRDLCLPCESGTFTSQQGQTSCIACRKGEFQSMPGQTFCAACTNGTYTNNEGSKTCIDCPFPLSSDTNSSTCPFCAEDFYLQIATVDPLEIFKFPRENCLPCPGNATCPAKTILQTIGIPPNFWRDSLNTTELYECKEKSKKTLRKDIGVEVEEEESENIVCKGFDTKQHETLLSDSAVIPNDNGFYCESGHTGPLCEVCTQENKYFDRGDNACNECLTSSDISGRCVILIVVLLAIAFVLGTIKNHFKQLSIMSSSLSLQAKVKIIISFFQLIYTMQEDADETQGIYGVEINDSLKKWLGFLEWFSFDMLQYISVPIECVGSMKDRLVFSVLWPFVAIMIISFGEFVIHVVTDYIAKRKKNENNLRGSISAATVSIVREQKWGQILYSTIFLFYFVLPIVANGIFEVINCEAYMTNDFTNNARSYLVSDPRIQCDAEVDDEYRGLLTIFWSFFTIWAVLVPLAFSLLLFAVRKSVRSKQITPVADACRFLWNDYTVSMMFWDIVETMKKLFLSGFIMFVDKREGSTKIFRLIIACVVTALYTVILLLARPYKKADDLYLAAISNFALICYFATGIILHLCDDNEACEEYIGLDLDSYSASLLVVCLIFGMVIISVLLLTVIIINTIITPKVHVVTSDEAPRLDLPESCKNHVFMSHLRTTDGDKADAISLKMQQYLPDLVISSEYDDTGNNISESVVFISLYSRGYFESTLCQSEIHSAVTLGKPIFIVYDGDDTFVDKMKEEFNECEYYKNINSDETADYVFDEDPIRWIKDQSGVYTSASLQAIYEKIFFYLPYYQNNPGDLDRGLKVPGDIGSTTKIKERLKLLVCDESIGSTGIAEEVKAMLSDRRNDYDLIESQNMTLRLQGLDDLSSSSSSDSESSRFLSVASADKMDDANGSCLGSVSNLSIASDDEDKKDDVNPSSETNASDDEDQKLDVNPSSSSASESNSLLSNSQRSVGAEGDDDDDEVLYDLTAANASMNQGSQNTKEVFLLYLSPEVLRKRNKKVLGKLMKKACNQNMKTLIMYDIDDLHPINFYWGELLNMPFDSTDKNFAIVSLVSTSLHFRQTSMRLVLETALTM